jgi:HEAT repeat protein
MFRTARRIAPLLYPLLLGTVACASVPVAAGALTGCADENEPETHVKRLSDPATRAAAATRLVQFFEDAMTRDDKNREGPTVKPLLDQIVEPMTQICVAGDLDERTNSKLIKFLADARDPRGEACLVKALKDYKVDSTEDDVRSAVRAVAAMKLKGAAGPLLDVFKKLHASKPKAQITYLDVHNAMIALLDPSWEGELVTLLGRPVDPKDQAGVTDEMFWQITAAEVLGLLKSTAAVKPLIKIVLNPVKAAGQTTAILALVKIGKPAIDPTIALLRSDDKDLVEYSKVENTKAAGGDKGAEKAAATAHIAAAALILATVGRQETAQPLIDALGKVDDVSRAVIARELTKVPKSGDTIKAFQDTFEKTGTGLSIPGASGGAREVLLEAAGSFYDPNFIPWIAKTLKDMKGEEGDLAPIREAALSTAMKLMTPDQAKNVDDMANLKTQGADGKASTVGKGFEKEYKLTKDLVAACSDKLDCYLGKLSDPQSQTDDQQFVGIKSAYMVGIYGKPETRQKLVDMMSKLSNPAVRFATVSVLDYLSPKGDTAIANALQKMVDDADATHDQEKIQADKPFKTVIYRLNARAQ